MDKLPLDLNDLVPKEVTFILGEGENQVSVTLVNWSLRVRAWATQKYTPDGVKKIFEEQRIEEIADIAFFMLKDKTLFKDKDAFLDKIITIQDQIKLIKGLLGAVGIGEPEIAKINAAAKAQEKKTMASEKAVATEDPKPKAPKKKTGAKSSTP